MMQNFHGVAQTALEGRSRAVEGLAAFNDVMVIGTVLLVAKWYLPVKINALLVEHPSSMARVAGTAATAAGAVPTAAAAVMMTAARNAPTTVMLTAVIGMTQTALTDTVTATMTGGAAVATIDAAMTTAIEDSNVIAQQQAM